jgi:hypothetical protein
MLAFYGAPETHPALRAQKKRGDLNREEKKQKEIFKTS